MNKNQYRIIFSKAKNMFIAVAENVKSNTKTAGQTKSSTEHREVIDQSFHQMWQVKSLVLSMSLFMSIAPVYAQMQADPAAAAAQQASIGVGQNQQGQNVPVVNIQTPKNGVSHNVYNQFDVLQPGMVLNNSRGGAGSVIVGQVGANPYLQTGEARVILNEVNSPTASRFEGNLEVAGQRADVIIANPSGINIQGGGFINANKAIFTTGKAQLNEDGSINQFVVDQGKINVNSTENNLGLGGNNNNADYVDIYAKAVELNAQVHANQNLQVITGSNTISQDLNKIKPNNPANTSPTFALDVKALGGMYANNIYIVGTDKGLGVNNAGTIQAPQNIVITNDGQIRNLGNIKSTNAKDSVISLSTKSGSDILSAGVIKTNGNLILDAGRNVNINSGQVIQDSNNAFGTISINSENNVFFSNNSNIQNNSGEVYVNAGRSLNVKSGASIASNDVVNLYATDDVNIQDSPIVYGKKGLNIFSENKSNIVNTTLATADNNNINIIDQNKGRLYPLSLTTLSNALVTITDGSTNEVLASKYTDSNGKVSFDLRTNTNVLHVNAVKGAIKMDPVRVSLDEGSSKTSLKNVNFQTNRFDTAGSGSVNISSNDAISLDQILVNNNGAGAVNIQAQEDVKWFNTPDVPVFTGKLDIRSNSNVDISGTKVTANDEINLLGKGLIVDTELRSNKDLNITATEHNLILNTEANLSAGGNINVSALAGKLNVNGLKATSSAGKLSLLADKDVILTHSGLNRSILLGAQGVNVASVGNGSVTARSTDINSGQGSILVSSNQNKTTLTDTTLNAGRNNEVFAKDDLSLDGVTILGQAHTALNSNNNINFDINSSKGSKIDSQGTLSVIAEKNINAQNLKLDGGAILLEAGESLNAGQTIELNARGSDLLRNNEDLNSLNGDLTIQTNNELTFDPRVHLVDVTGDIEFISKNGDLNFIGISGSNGQYSGKVLSLLSKEGSIYLQGENVNINGSDIESAKSIKIISTKGDILIDAVKNSLINAPSNYYKEIIEGNLFVHNIGFNYIKYLSQTPAQNLSANDQIMQAILGVEDLNSTFNEMQSENDWLRGAVDFYSSRLNGYEHKNAKLLSNDGDIEIHSSNGILIRGSSLNAKNDMLLESNGVIDKSLTAGEVVNQFNAGILIDGNIDTHAINEETAPNFNVREVANSAILTAGNVMKIQTLGDSGTNDLILQGTSLTTSGDMYLESGNNLILSANQYEEYDRKTNTTTKRNWLGKKKTTTTITENQKISADPVELKAKNINLKSKGDIFLYSTDMKAEEYLGARGNIDIKAKNIYLIAVDEVNRKEVNSRTKSSFLGFKYNDTKSTGIYKKTSQLPVKSKADYITTKSDFDTLIQGSEFDYLSGMSIEAGRDIIISPITNSVEIAKKKTSNSVVWQSMQDKGSITETAKLPSFNGPTPPTFKADGGIEVQIPIGEQDQYKVQVKEEALKLANQPGNEYLKELLNRNDVDWNSVILTQQEWDYKQQGLTGAGAAIIAIIVTVVTSGAGVSAAGGILGASQAAATNTLLTQASISLINNGGDIAKTLKDLGSKESVKGLVASVVTAGLMSKVSTQLGIQLDSAGLSGSSYDRIINNFASSVGSTIIQTSINGGDLKDNLEAALLTGLAGAIQGELATQIGLNLSKVDPSVLEYTIHKIAHAAVGCATGSIVDDNGCGAGAIGAGVGEIFAEFMIPEGKTSLDLTDAERTNILNLTKLVAGTTAAYAGYDVNLAANKAYIAVENNSLAKLATTAGKAAYKVAKQINDMPASVRANLKPSQVAEMLKKEGVQGVIDIGDNIATLINPASTLGDRAFALIDLAIGIDLKAGKNVDALKVDQKVINKNFYKSPRFQGASSTTYARIDNVLSTSRNTTDGSGVLNYTQDRTRSRISDYKMLTVGGKILQDSEKIKISVLNDGTRVIYRPSRTGPNTIEIQNSKGKGVVEIRYHDKS